MTTETPLYYDGQTVYVYLNPHRGLFVFGNHSPEMRELFLNEYESWQIRPVFGVIENEPDDFVTLEDAFRLGQNDFQPQDNARSVSVGDIFELGTHLYLCEGRGFSLLK